MDLRSGTGQLSAPGDVVMDALLFPSDYFSDKLTISDISTFRSNGYNRIYASLITGRCGSTFFSKMCQNAGFGYGEEPFNERGISGFSDFPPSALRLFVERTMEMGSMEGRYYFQITPPRLDALAPMFDGDAFSTFVDRYSLILRRNIVAQALSYIMAVRTGVWHSYTGTSAVDYQDSIAVSDMEIAQWVLDIHNMEVRAVELCAHQKNTVVLFYEDIVLAPLEMLNWFFNDCSYEPNHKISTQSIFNETPQKTGGEWSYVRYRDILKRYPCLYDVLSERMRGRIPTATVLEFVAQVMSRVGE